MTNSATRALEIIATQQRPDGSFVVVSNPATSISLAAELTIQATMLDLFMDCSIAEVRACIQRLAKYLASVLFNDDFETILATTDTRAVFQALAVLYEYDPQLLPVPALAACIQFLTMHEQEPGGPYRNVQNANGEPDIDTNVSIARLLYQLGGPFPKLMDFVTGSDDSTPSRYFTEPWVADLQFEKLQRVMAPARTKSVIVAPAGRLNRTVYFYKNAFGGDAVVFGSLAVVAARTLYATKTKSRKAAGTSAYSPIVRRARKAVSGAPAMAKQLDGLFDRIIAIDRNQEIGLLALRFAPALGSKRPALSVLETLGAANLCNWVAYTLYDDCMDGDGAPTLLPLANIALRAAVRLFEEAVPGAAFAETVRRCFGAVDAANAWELAHCRFDASGTTITVGPLPDYDDLSHLYGRSLTHCLPVLGAAAAVPDKLDVTALTHAFQRYLAVRQLSDDLHDWQKDIHRGHVSSVVARSLHDADVSAGTYTFAELMPKLGRTFLYKTLPSMNAQMLTLAAEAHASIRSAAGVSSPNVLDELIDIYEQSAHKLLNEHAHTIKFLAKY